ncbi:MAG TPA: HD domain-containing protein [Bacteroidales bacterium]|jgi:uncharacterized protein|nr:HD domain-containing protein [Bacteroidales bacterium]HOU97493.1 HD domain-containing protein [Bacteroidales bacterium]
MSEIIEKTIEFVKRELSDSEGGHDWWHCYRVWGMSKKIAESEDVKMEVVELAALLHDIADSKFYDGNEEVGPQKAYDFLTSMGVDENIKNEVIDIIRKISFKNKASVLEKSKALQIVQDADRLDAIGAIGIARAFNYGGYKNRSLYNPDIKPNLNMSKEEYKNTTAPTINHFYEKLLLLKDMMNTKKAKQIAENRHRFMQVYLEQFYKEWETEDFE